MRRYNIFTLGIILTSIYSINAMAAWPTKPATNIWTNSGHTTLAQMRCGDCCKNDCWLPDGTYYDSFGQFTNSCGSCPSGQYDIGFGSCINANTNGSGFGYWGFDGEKSDADPYGLTAAGQWGVTFDDYGQVKGIASCNNTSGTFGVATDQEFSNTSNGQYCWCKMTSPAASRWVFLDDYSSANCVNLCLRACSIYVRNPSELRSGVFGSVDFDKEPTCDSDRTYSMVNGVCKKDKLSCSSGSYDIGFSSCISASTNGTAYGYINDSTGPYGADSYNTATYGLTADQTWGVTFSGYGNVTGIASCNSTSGSSYGETTTRNFSQSSTGQYCWCKMTSPAASVWVFADDPGDADYCALTCVSSCSDGVQRYSAFRVGVFGSVE